MTEDRYYVKIVPHRGDTIHRFVVRQRHVLTVAAVLVVALATAVAYGVVQYRHVRQERAALVRIAGQAEMLHRQLQHVQDEDQQITQLIGAPNQKPTPAARPQVKAPVKPVSWTGVPNVASLAQHVAKLAADSAALAQHADQERTLAMRVLNLRQIHALAVARLVAFIPSIDPVNNAVVTGCFCYRTSPSVEFHEGVDLSANYGDTVRAAAAGTIVAAGWDGEYGLKIDIDHGNGYHTWYAHLSRIDVSVGQRVYKGEAIAAVGATGFATGPHLHYQVMLDGTPVDPTPYLHGIPASVIAALR